MRFTHAFATSPVCSSVADGLHHGNVPNVDRWPSSSHAKDRAATGSGEAGDGVLPRRRLLCDERLRTAEHTSPRQVGLQFRVRRQEALRRGRLEQTESGAAVLLPRCRSSKPHRTFPITGKTGEELTIPPFYPDHPLVRADWANYLAAIEVLGREGRQGPWIDWRPKVWRRNTMVILFGDPRDDRTFAASNGSTTPGFRCRSSCAGPVAFSLGKPTTRLVSLIDVAPTFSGDGGKSTCLHICKDGDMFAGKSASASRGNLRGPRPLWRCRGPDPLRADARVQVHTKSPPRPVLLSTESLQEIAVSRADTDDGDARNRGRLKGRQAEWFADSRPAEEFYDLRSDPHELNNLADDPAHRENVSRLRKDARALD